MIFLSAPDVGPREHDLVREALDSGYLAPAGPMIERFESDLSRYTGFAHAVALSSGTAALHLALRMVGIGAGDIVVVPSFTFIASVAPAIYLGATPVFVDCDADSWVLEPAILEDALQWLARNGRPARAVVAVDLYGRPVDMVGLREVCDRHGAELIADSAEALGSFRHNRHAGRGARFAALSFNGNKIVTTSGGGALLTDEADNAARIRNLAQQARQPVPHYEHVEVGYNYRMSNICAAIGIAQLERIEEKVSHRRTVYERYRSALEGEEFTFGPASSDDVRENRWLSTALVRDADPAKLVGDLTRAGYEARRLWKPMHLQPVFAEAEMLGGSVCERLYAEGFCLPSGPQVTPAIQAKISEHILSQRGGIIA